MTGLAVRVLVVVVERRRALEARAQPPRDVGWSVVGNAADAREAVAGRGHDGPQAQPLAERRDARVPAPRPARLGSYHSPGVGPRALGVGLP